jgi:hypothetical protein
MHIRRDNLLAKPYPIAHNFEKVLSTHTLHSGSSAEHATDPLKQMEALRKGFIDQKKAELLTMATGKAGRSWRGVSLPWRTGEERGPLLHLGTAEWFSGGKYGV